MAKELIQMSNREKFSALETFNLPTNQYVIVGSGPLGIRNLRAIQDIDIVVSLELWDALAPKYGVTNANGIQKIVFPGGLIEAFREGSFSDNPDIANAEIIDGLPFAPLENVLEYKRKSGREKDLKDILLIEEWRTRRNP